MKDVSLRFIGHAGFLLKCNGISLLCDPWVSEKGAFLGSWHQYPPNDLINRESLFDVDYLYISHQHHDHFDRQLLQDFPKHKVTVLIADFLSNSFANELVALGFSRIVKLPDWKEYRLIDDFTVTMFKDQSLYKIDSSLLIKVESITILDKNDCHIAGEYLSRFKDYGIDVLLAQFSGAMWYPAVYGYNKEEERKIASSIRRNLVDSFVEVANGVAAKHVMHCAGPPCFLEDEFFPLNFAENGIFHDQQDVFRELYERVDGKLHLLLPADELHFEMNREPFLSRSRPFDFSCKRELLNQYRARRLPAIRAYLDSLEDANEGFIEQFEAYIRSLFSVSPYIRQKINAVVKFTLTGVHGGSVFVDTRRGFFKVTQSCAEEPNYAFVIASRIGKLLVEKKENWEELLLSMRFRANRAPDVYNWPLFAILRYGHEPALIGQIERIMKESEGETVVVKSDGKDYRVQRYCPHAGEDLSFAKIEDGQLICRRHQWAFDLRAGGRCVRGGSISLKIYDDCDAAGTQEE